MSNKITFRQFSVLYKELMWDIEHGVKVDDNASDRLYAAFKSLDDDDAKELVRLILGDIKEFYDEPLSKRDIATLKFINSKEMIRVKTWIVRAIVYTLIIAFATFCIALLIDLYPALSSDTLDLIRIDIKDW